MRRGALEAAGDAGDAVSRQGDAVGVAHGRLVCGRSDAEEALAPPARATVAVSPDSVHASDGVLPNETWERRRRVVDLDDVGGGDHRPRQ